MVKRFFLLMGLLCSVGLVVGQEKFDADEPVEYWKNNLYKSSETIAIDITHTRLELKPFFEKNSLYGKAFLNIKPYNQPVNEITLDAKAMKIRQVFVIHPTGFVEVDFKYDDLKLHITLDKTYTKEEQFTLFIEYTAHPYTIEELGIEKAYGRGLYIIDGQDKNPYKPTQLWTIGETEANSSWFPTVDAANESFTQEIYITVDETYATLSNGVLKESKLNDDGTRTDYWSQEKPHAPYLAMLAVGQFSIAKDDWGPLELYYYTIPEYYKDVRKVFGRTPYMMSYFSNLLKIEYPWEKYAQVVVYDFVSGGMENTSASTYYQGLYADKYDLLDVNYDYIIAHELMHQWFGNLVTCESWSHLTLNEAFANYSEFLWYEHKYGKNEADKQLYDYNDTYFQETKYKVEPIVNFYYEDADQDLFDAHRYEKSAAVLHMLRNYLGETYFWEGVTQYLKTHRHKTVEITDLRYALEKVSGMDLYWFFDQWFMQPGHPVVDIASDYDVNTELLTVHIDQVQTFEDAPIYRIPLSIDIYVDGKVERKDVWIENKHQVFEFTVANSPQLVNVDAEKMMLWQKNEKKTIEEWQFQYENAPLYVDKIEALEALVAQQENPIAKAVIKAALEDPFWGIRRYAVDNIDLKKDKLSRLAADVVEKIALSDSSSRTRNAALEALINYDHKLAIPVADSLLENDSSRLVLGSALAFLYPQDKEKYYKKAQQFETIRNFNLAGEVAEIYAEKADKEKHEFFKKNLSLVRERYMHSLVKSYVAYLKRMDKTTVDEASDLLFKMAMYEESKYVNAICRNALYELLNFYKDNRLPNSEEKAAIMESKTKALEE